MYHQRFKTEDQRFREKYSIDATTGCWLWISGQEGHYPAFWTGERHIKANRYVYQKRHGVVLQPDQCVCHHCDNPKCVNPDHLFLGDHKRNMEDKAAKGRSHRPRGAKNGRAVLTPESVALIRREYAAGGISQDKLASKYGSSQARVSAAIRGETWA